MEKLTQEYLKEILEYNPETGIFTNKINRNSRARKGEDAGYLRKDGYLQVSINWNKFKLHRLAWFYVFGIWPKDQIDHINGIKKDNRISNLREANNAENSRNRGSSKNTSSKYKGVSKSGNNWRSYIMYKLA